MKLVNGEQVTPDWIYTGPERGMGDKASLPRNIRGVNGRCKAEAVEGSNNILIDIDGIRFEVPRAIAEELNAALCTRLRPFAGMSIFERLMDLLDTVIDRMMTGAEAGDGRDPGRAEGLCIALAMIRNTHTPDYEAEKERAMERWEVANPE